MNILELVLRFAGATLLVLATAHFGFSKRFHWREDFARVSALNRQIFYSHCFFLCFGLVLLGLLCLICPDALLARSRLGLLVAGGLNLFWFCRLLAQFFFYDAAHWRGKPFETVAHVGVSFLWTFYAAVFGGVWWLQWGG